MLSERFWVFHKNHIHKEKWISQKVKKWVKNVIKKYVSYESLSSVNLVYDNFILELWY